MSQVLVVTPEQFKAGWEKFRWNQIPNITYHSFVPIKKLPDGNWLVEAPKV